MASQNEFFITVRRELPSGGRDLVTPKRILVPVARVRSIDLNNKRGGSVLKLQDPSRTYELYENVNQYNTAVEPTNTNITPDYAAVTATGSVVGDAAAMTKYWNKVSASDGAKGVKLLAVASLTVQVVENAGTGILKVYPGTGDLIVSKAGVAGAINAAVSIPAGETWTFVKSPTAALTVLTAKEA